MGRWDKAKKTVLEAGREIWQKGYVVGTSGNVSLRFLPEKGRELLAITPSGCYYDSLTINDIQIIDFEGQTVEGNLSPSIEKMLHVGIYKVRKDVNAIVHTHSTFASIIAVAGLDIPVLLEEQISFIGGEVKLAKYAPCGSPELVKEVLDVLGERRAVLMSHHGVVAVGKSMREALTVCELVERIAKVYFCALSLGKVSPLPGYSE